MSPPVTAVVDKTSPDAKLGLSIKRSATDGSTRIGRISGEGLFAKTDLKEGMKVLEINDKAVDGMDLNDILDILKNAQGSVSIVGQVDDDKSSPAAPAAVATSAAAGTVTASVDKSSPDAKLGLSIKRSAASGSTRIGRISAEGLFAKSELKEGMRVLSINGTNVQGMELNDILAVLKDAQGTITIVADNEPDVPVPSSVPTVISAAAAAPPPASPKPASRRSVTQKYWGAEHTATVTRANPEQKLGISLKRDPIDNTTLVGKVNPEGLFADTPLKEGMLVVSVNNTLAGEKSLNELLTILSESDNSITILAREAAEPSTPGALSTALAVAGGAAVIGAAAAAGAAAANANNNNKGSSLRNLVFGASSSTEPTGPPRRHITAVVNKDNADSKLGVSLRRLPTSGVTVVGKINPEGPFAQTDLKEGMKVLKINDRDTADMELNELLGMLKNSVGAITVLAEEEGGALSPKSVTSVGSGPKSPMGEPPKERITAVVTKDTPDTKLGISVRRTSVTNTTMVGRVDEHGPFAATGLKEGMRIVTIKAGDQDCTDMELDGMLDALKHATGEVVIVAEPFLPFAPKATGGYKPLPKPDGAGHSIIFKKTFKAKGMGTKVQTFSFHGQGITQSFIDGINRHLASIAYAPTANPLKFHRNSLGHYVVEMNHDCQKYHEEDALAAIFDAMEMLGWGFRYQYASQYQTSSTSFTSRDIFIFAKLIEI